MDIEDYVFFICLFLKDRSFTAPIKHTLERDEASKLATASNKLKEGHKDGVVCSSKKAITNKIQKITQHGYPNAKTGMNHWIFNRTISFTSTSNYRLNKSKSQIGNLKNINGKHQFYLELINLGIEKEEAKLISDREFEIR